MSNNKLITKINGQEFDFGQIVHDLKVTNDLTYVEAARLLINWTKLQIYIKDTFDPLVQAAHKAHKEAINSRKKHLEAVDKAIQAVKEKMNEYHSSVAEMQFKEKEFLLQDEEEFLPMSPPPPHVDGIVYNNRWKAVIKNPQKIASFCAANWDQWGHLITINQAELNKLAKYMHKTLDNTIPGAQADISQSISIRQKRGV